MYYDKWWKNHGRHHMPTAMTDVQSSSSSSEACQAKKTVDQRAMANALGIVNIGGIFVVLLCGLAFAVIVAIVEFCLSSRLAKAAGSGNNGNKQGTSGIPGMRQEGVMGKKRMLDFLKKKCRFHMVFFPSHIKFMFLQPKKSLCAELVESFLVFFCGLRRQRRSCNQQGQNDAYGASAAAAAQVVIAREEDEEEDGRQDDEDDEDAGFEREGRYSSCTPRTAAARRQQWLQGGASGSSSSAARAGRRSAEECSNCSLVREQTIL